MVLLDFLIVVESFPPFPVVLEFGNYTSVVAAVVAIELVNTVH